MSIYKKLIEVQSELKAPKGQYNKFGKYAYRKADDILEAVKPLLKSKGLAIILTDEVKTLGTNCVTRNTNVIQGATEKAPSFDKSTQTTEEEIQVVVEASATLVNESGECIIVKAQAGIEKAGGMQLPQAYGSASSYARKYAMSGLFAIDDEQDSDSANDHGKAPTGKKASVPAKAPIKKKPELNPSHKNWIAAATHVSRGGDIETDIMAKYELSPANRSLLVAEADKISKK